eukprot:gene16769-8231_t
MASTRRQPAQEGGYVQRCVILHRDENGYGVTVSGENPVYVQSVKENSAANKAGVKVGDKIIKVNGTMVANSNHVEVVHLIKSGSYVALTLLGRSPGERASTHSPVPSERQRPLSLVNNISKIRTVESTEYKPDIEVEALQRNLDHERLFFQKTKEQYVLEPSLESQKVGPKHRMEHRSIKWEHEDLPPVLAKLADSQIRIRAIEDQLKALASGAPKSNSVRTVSRSTSDFHAARKPFQQHQRSHSVQGIKSSSSFKPVTAAPEASPTDLSNSSGDRTPSSSSEESLLKQISQTKIDYNSVPAQKQKAPKRTVSLRSFSRFYDRQAGPERQPTLVERPTISPPVPISPPTVHSETTDIVNVNHTRSKSDELNHTRTKSDVDDEPVSQAKKPYRPNNTEEAKMDSNSFVPGGKIENLQPVNSAMSVISMEEEEFDSADEKIDDHGPFLDLDTLKSKPAHLAVFLHFLMSNSDPSALFFWLVTETYAKEEGSLKDFRKWAYEIYSTFLAPSAFTYFAFCYLANESMRSRVDRASPGAFAFNEVSEQLADFRSKRALGLGSLFGDHQLEDDLDKDKELKIVEQTLLPHLEALTVEVEKNPKESVQYAAKNSAMASSLTTFMKHVGVSVKTGGSQINPLERHKSFAEKERSSLFKFKPSKKVVTVKGHQFIGTQYTECTLCNYCEGLLWGIGTQGMQCQVCEYNVHKGNCMESIEVSCTGIKRKLKIMEKPKIHKPVISRKPGIQKGEKTGKVEGTDDTDSESLSLPNSHNEMRSRGNSLNEDPDKDGTKLLHCPNAMCSLAIKLNICKLTNMFQEDVKRGQAICCSGFSVAMTDSHEIVGLTLSQSLFNVDHCWPRQGRDVAEKNGEAFKMDLVEEASSRMEHLHVNILIAAFEMLFNTVTLVHVHVALEHMVSDFSVFNCYEEDQSKFPAHLKGTIAAMLYRMHDVVRALSFSAPSFSFLKAEFVILLRITWKKQAQLDEERNSKLSTQLTAKGRLVIVQMTVYSTRLLRGVQHAHGMEMEPRSMEPPFAAILPLYLNFRLSEEQTLSDQEAEKSSSKSPGPYEVLELKLIFECDHLLEFHESESLHEPITRERESKKSKGDYPTKKNNLTHAQSVKMTREFVRLLDRKKTITSVSTEKIGQKGDGLNMDNGVYVAQPYNRKPDSPPMSDEEEEQDEELELDDVPSLPWSQMVDKKIIKKLKDKEVKRQEVIHELINTEKTHVRHLKVLEKVFLKPMQERQIMPPEVIQQIFPNLAELIEIHTSLLADMNTRCAQQGDVITSVADIILARFDGAPGEKAKEVAALFNHNQRMAMEMLKNRTKKDSKLAAFMARQEESKYCRRLKFNDIMANTHQRLTKYPLLLREMLKSTPSSNPELKELEKCARCCKDILNHVNKSMKETENKWRLIELSKKIDMKALEGNTKIFDEFKDFDLTKHKLVHEGDLIWRINRTKTIELHVLLLDLYMILLQKQDDKLLLKSHSTTLSTGLQDMKTTHSPIIKLQNLLTRDVATDKRAFFLVSTSSVGPQIYELVTSTILDRNTWVKVITECVDASLRKGKERGRRGALCIPPSGSVALSESIDEKEETPPHGSSSRRGSAVSKDENGNKETEKVEEKQKEADEVVYEELQTPEVVEEKPVKKIDPPSKERIAELYEQLRIKDDEVKKLLEDKAKIVAELRCQEFGPTITAETTTNDSQAEAREFIFAAILQGSRLAAAVNEIFNVHQRSESNGLIDMRAMSPNPASIPNGISREESQNDEDRVIQSPQEVLIEATTTINEQLTSLLFKSTASFSIFGYCLDLISTIFILPPVHEADYLVLLYRLQSDLQESQAAIKRLTQTANSDVTSESGESPDIVPSSSLPSLSSLTTNASTMTPDIMVSDDISEEDSNRSEVFDEIKSVDENSHTSPVTSVSSDDPILLSNPFKSPKGRLSEPELIMGDRVERSSSFPGSKRTYSSER